MAYSLLNRGADGYPGAYNEMRAGTAGPTFASAGAPVSAGPVGGGSAGGQVNTLEDPNKKIIGYDAQGNAIFASDSAPVPSNQPSGQATGGIIGYDPSGNAIFQSDNPPTPVNGSAPAPVAEQAATAPPITYDPTIAGMDQRQAMINQLLGGAQGRAAPQSAAAMLGPAATSAGQQLGTASLAQDGDFRAQQAGLVGQLGRLASGQDSYSRLQLQDAAARNIAQQRALAASARPGQGAMAQRLAAQQAGQIGGGLASQQALAGIQERAQAGSALQNLLGTARGQDQQLGMFNAGQTNAQNLAGAQLGQQNNQFNAGALNAQQMAAAQMLQQNNQFNASAGLQQNGLNDAMTQGLLGQQLGGMNLQQSGGLSAAQMLERQRAQELELQNRLQIAQLQGGGSGNFLSGLLGAAKTGLSLYGQIRNGQPNAPTEGVNGDWGA